MTTSLMYGTNNPDSKVITIDYSLQTAMIGRFGVQLSTAEFLSKITSSIVTSINRFQKFLSNISHDTRHTKDNAMISTYYTDSRFRMVLDFA